MKPALSQIDGGKKSGYKFTKKDIIIMFFSYIMILYITIMLVKREKLDIGRICITARELQA